MQFIREPSFAEHHIYQGSSEQAWKDPCPCEAYGLGTGKDHSGYGDTIKWGRRRPFASWKPGSPRLSWQRIRVAVRCWGGGKGAPDRLGAPTFGDLDVSLPQSVSPSVKWAGGLKSLRFDD